MPDSTRQEQIAVGNQGERAQFNYYKHNAWRSAGKGGAPRIAPNPQLIVMHSVCSCCKIPHPRLITIPGKFKDRCPHCTDKPAEMG